MDENIIAILIEKLRVKKWLHSKIERGDLFASFT